MNKYHEVEGKLLEIEGGLFQNICDEVLFSTEEDCNKIFRPGSQVGTTKTKPGTPDTYFFLTDGTYVLIEYTTQDPKKIKPLLKKIKEDIDKCADPKKTGLQPEEIDKLIYWCTADFTPVQHKSLVAYARKKKIKLDLRGIHALVRMLLGSCVKTAKNYLSVAIDTGQVLLPEVFAEEYSAPGFSTPLTNSFFNRQSEMDALLQSLASDVKVTVLTGPPGTGKSRLAMEVFQKTHSLNKAIKGFCISNKNAYIHDDLRLYLAGNCPYLILVDDANRQSGHLESLLGLLKEKRTEKIHVVITVRDYALGDILNRCRDFEPVVIRIGRFSDEELTEILTSVDFGLKGKALQRILKISNGNARLSVMAAKVFLECGELSKLDDVAEIYDKYFESAVGDERIFSDPDLLRSLGLLAFFFSIDLDDKDFIIGLCRRFKIKEYSFRAAMIELEKLEIAESNDDMSIMKISDQVLGTYFFYRTFIREGLLSFKTVMAYYRESHLGRIRDAVNPASSTFTFEKIYSKVDPILSEFWPEISKNSGHAYDFLNLFWSYRKYDLFGFVHSKITSAIKPDKEIFCMEEKSLIYIDDRDRPLNLLSNFFSESTEDIHTAIGLSLDYVRKYPDSYSQLIKTLRSKFSFVREDQEKNCFRQIALWTHILPEAKKGDKLSVNVFFDVVQELIKSDGGILRLRTDSKAILTDNVLTSKNGVYHFRASAWEFLHEHAKVDLPKIEAFLLKYIDQFRNQPSKVYHFDFYYLNKLFNDYFENGKFAHCYIVRSLLDGFAREKLIENTCIILKKQFNCKAYQYFRLLSWDRLRDRDMYDYEFTDHDKYGKIKEKEVRQALNFSTLEEFKVFYQIITEIYDFKPGYIRGFHYSLNTVLNQILNNDCLIALSVMNFLINSGNKVEVLPVEVYRDMFSFGDFADQLYSLIMAGDFKRRTEWLETYMDFIPEDKLRKEHANDYLKLVESTQDKLNIRSYTLNRFLNVKKEVFNHAISLVVSRSDEKNVQLILDEELFKEHIIDIGNIDLVKKAYLLQERIQERFDYRYQGMLEVIGHDSNFVMEYIRSLPMGYDGLSFNDYYDLNILWTLDDAENHISDILNYLVSPSSHYSSYSSAHIFFSGLDLEQKERAFKFVLAYLRENATDLNKVDMIMNVARNDLSEFEPKVLCEWLSVNSSFEDFKKVSWQNSGLSGGGNTIFNEIRANRFQKVLDMFSGMGRDSYKYIKHKAYLNEQVSSYKRAAIFERRRNFLYGY